MQNFSFSSRPTVFWDVFGQQGHPVRTTISEMGPLLLARVLNLNEVQAGILTLIFKIADDNAIGSQIGRQIIQGALGAVLGGGKKSRW